MYSQSIWDGRIKNPEKTRTFLKTRPDTRTGAKKEDVSGETRTYGNPSHTRMLNTRLKSHRQQKSFHTYLARKRHLISQRRSTCSAAERTTNLIDRKTSVRFSSKNNKAIIGNCFAITSSISCCSWHRKYVSHYMYWTAVGGCNIFVSRRTGGETFLISGSALLTL